jgi:hypothetical protein
LAAASSAAYGLAASSGCCDMVGNTDAGGVGLASEVTGRIDS